MSDATRAPCHSDRDHCWHRYRGEDLGDLTLWHCCRPACADVLATDREREELTHGYMKGWRPTATGREPPRLYVRRRAAAQEDTK